VAPVKPASVRRRAADLDDIAFMGVFLLHGGQAPAIDPRA
jgi:hypothetical protein